MHNIYMERLSLPSELTYTGPRLKGQATQFQQWQIYPQSSLQSWDTNSIVKFALNTTTGTVDWYRTHLEFEVEAPIQNFPVGGVQVDSSAYGAISQLVITQQGFQLERIMQHDVLMAYLIDIGFSQLVCQNKEGQGLGFNNIPSSSSMSCTTSSTNCLNVPRSSATNAHIDKSSVVGVEIQSTNSYSPTLMPVTATGYISQFSSDAVNVINYQESQSTIVTGGTVQSHRSLTNPLYNPQFSADQAVRVTQMGRFGNVRAQYKYNLLKNEYPDTPDSYPLGSPYIANQTWNMSNFTTTGFNKNNPYQIAFPINRNKGSLDAPATYTPLPSCGISGYSKTLCPDFCKGCFQPMLSPTIPQCQMSNGAIQNLPFPISKKRFRIPLCSAIIGLGIPPDQFRLWPIQFYEGLLLQITLNPYWMFTTGLSDIHQCDTAGASLQIARKWRFTQFKWVLHIYTINDQQLSQYMQAVLYKPMALTTKMWSMLIQYQLPTGANVKQTNTIPCNCQSLSQIVILFLSNEYLEYTGARKQFRLSNNITSMQLRANTVYYPIQPIIGHAGNPQTIDQNGDNWNFYELLLLSNNYLFSANSPAPRINTKNFAINGRIYDIYNRNPLYQPTSLPVNNVIANLANVNLTNVNPDTAMGQSWFHENRYVGRAAFVYSFQPYGHSKTMVTGVNTLAWKQFEVTFNNSTINQFPYDQTQYVFGECNVMLMLQKDRPIKILGV